MAARAKNTKLIVGILLEKDWVERHRHYDMIKRRTGAGFVMRVRSLMSPDELVDGLLTGVDAPKVIALPDPNPKQVTQVKLDRYFMKQ